MTSPATPPPASRPGAPPPGGTAPDGTASGAVAARTSAKVEEYVFAALVVALGVFTLVDATTISLRNQSAVGPRAFPYAVGALLVVTGIATIVATARGRLGEAEEAEDVDTGSVRTDWLTVGKLGVVLVAHLLLIEPVGWPVAAVVLFAGAAWTLGAVWWKALVVAVVLALVVQVLFASGLGLSLPAGIFEGVPLLDG
ncbi:tripartite tricarboxylate transporter TctB family protein [Saccharothrix sp. Mg75]|uniref:tripartite tricarboxylate transporter TctB family protein n=1 Tax=Saccharothrix sp. Mg75 TaxID=3445357 RepID=UPI003EEC82B4